MTKNDGREPRNDTPAPGANRDGWMMFRYSGELQLEALTADQIDPRDIAHSLAGINRFIGQTRTPIPVAWHSLVVAAACRADGRGTELEALLHDGAEAYVGDWIRPLRHRIGKGVFELHDRIQAKDSA